MRILVTAILLLWGCPIIADADHDEIKRLRDDHTIVSLEKIYRHSQQRFPGGRILEAKLEKRDDRYLYELYILDADGEVQELYYDAHTGEWLFYEAYLPDPQSGKRHRVEIDARTGTILRREQEE